MRKKGWARILALALLCAAIVSMVATEATADGAKTRLKKLEALRLDIEKNMKAIQPGGKRAESFAESLRDMLRVCDDLAEKFIDEIGARRGMIRLTSNNSMFSDYSTMYFALCTVFNEYVTRYSSSQNSKRVDSGKCRTAWAWLAEAVRPLLSDTRIQGAHRELIRDLYAACSVGAFSQYDGDTRFDMKDTGSDMKDTEVEARYAALIRSVDDEMKSRILSKVPDRRYMSVPLDGLIEQYVLHGDGGCISDRLSGVSIPRFWTLLSRLYAQRIEWASLFDQQVEAVLKEIDGEKDLHRAVQLLLDFQGLNEAVPGNWGALGKQAYVDFGSTSFADMVGFFGVVSLPPLWDRIRELGIGDEAMINRNAYVCWDSASLAAFAGEKKFKPSHPLADGYLLLWGKKNEHNGWLQKNMSQNEIREQCIRIHYLMTDIGALVTDPNDARVGIEYTHTYSYYGKYYKGDDSVSAYDCKLQVRAIDLVTGKQIAQGTFYGSLPERIDGNFPADGSYYASGPSFISIADRKEISDEAQAFRDKVAAFMAKPF